MPRRRTRIRHFTSSRMTGAAGLHLQGSSKMYLFEPLCKESGCDVLQLGRSVKCQIRLPGDGFMSNEHALVKRNRAGQWILHDKASTNGVFVDGKRITEPVRLLVKMNVRIGYTRLIAVDEDGLVPVSVRLVGEYCYRVTEVYGSHSAAARRVDIKREFIRTRANRWKRQQLFGKSDPDRNGT